MADYNDYLDYLHHIDDTTVLEFKKKEDELRHQIDVIRDQSQKDIKNIQDRATAEKVRLEVNHKSAIDALASKYQASIDKLKDERTQLEAKHKIELKKINTEKENNITRLINENKASLAKVEAEKNSVINQLTDKHKAAMEAAISDVEKKRNSEVQLLMKKITNYDNLLQQKDNTISELSEKHDQELKEIHTKQEKQINVINEQNEEKLKGIASQLQCEKEKLKDFEHVWQNKLLLANKEFEQKIKDQDNIIKRISGNFSDERDKFEQHISRLNHDIQILKNENNAISANRYTISTQLEEAKRRNEELESHNKELIKRIKELEIGVPAIDLKNGLLTFTIITFALAIILMLVFI